MSSLARSSLLNMDFEFSIGFCIKFDCNRVKLRIARLFSLDFISQGINSVPAELWLLPRWFPFHPWRMWCHSRMVYLPMSYLYSTRYGWLLSLSCVEMARRWGGVWGGCERVFSLPSHVLCNFCLLCSTHKIYKKRMNFEMIGDTKFSLSRWFPCQISPRRRG